MNYITRSQWGARPPRPRSSIGRASGVALHWEGPHMGDFAHDQCFGKVRGIQNFHMDSRGWADIAYNFLVCPHGAVFEGRGLAVRSAANGTNDGNARYLAICYLSGDGDPFTDAARQGFLDVIYHCRVAGNGAEVRPHSSFKATACPGNEIRAWIAAGLPAGGAVSPPPPAPPAPPADNGARPAPAFPLPRGHWFGPVSRDSRNHSGYWVGDRAGVVAIRNRLIERGWRVARSDRYDDALAKVIEQFQREKRLSVDGLVGGETWPVLWTAPIT